MMDEEKLQANSTAVEDFMEKNSTVGGCNTIQNCAWNGFLGFGHIYLGELYGNYCCMYILSGTSQSD